MKVKDVITALKRIDKDTADVLVQGREGEFYDILQINYVIINEEDNSYEDMMAIVIAN